MRSPLITKLKFYFFVDLNRENPPKIPKLIKLKKVLMLGKVRSARIKIKINNMGQITAKINLSNPKDSELQPLEVDALVDTGALTLCIPQHIVIQLALEVLEQREIVTANGQRQKCDYVGPLKIQFANRSCYCGALVIGDSVLLGAISLEDMDLVIHPSTRTLSVNPESPNIPIAIVKVISNT